MVDYLPSTGSTLVGDAHVGIWIMLGAIISAGALYGFQLGKNRKNYSFPKPLVIAIFLYYVGVLMYTPSINPSMLVGPYAYFSYGMTTVAAGLALTTVATFASILLYTLLGTARFLLAELWFVSTMWFDALVQRYYEKYIKKDEQAPKARHLRGVD